MKYKHIYIYIHIYIYKYKQYRCKSMHFSTIILVTCVCVALLLGMQLLAADHCFLRRLIIASHNSYQVCGLTCSNIKMSSIEANFVHNIDYSSSTIVEGYNSRCYIYVQYTFPTKISFGARFHTKALNASLTLCVLP